MNRSHPTQPKIENSKEEQTIWFDACLEENRKVTAIIYCQGCEENQCEECDSIHLNRRLRNHVRTDPKPKAILDIENSTTKKKQLLNNIKSNLDLSQAKNQPQGEIEFIYENYKKKQVENKILQTQYGKEVQFFKHKRIGWGVFVIGFEGEVEMFCEDINMKGLTNISLCNTNSHYVVLKDNNKAIIKWYGLKGGKTVKEWIKEGNANYNLLLYEDALLCYIKAKKIDQNIGRKTMKFLVEKVQENESFHAYIWSQIKKSKVDQKVSEYASIGITLLNYARESFTGKDLRKISIKGADLSYGVFDSTNFSGADLSEVNFSNSWLQSADLSMAIMGGVRFDVIDSRGNEIIVFGTKTFSEDYLKFREKNTDRNGVNTVVYSPDGKTLATGSRDKKVKFWDIQTGKLKKTLTNHKHYVRSIAYSPDGKTVATASSDDTIILWDSRSYELKKTLKGHASSVRSVVFSPNGRIIATGGRDEKVKLWDAKTGKLKKTLIESGWVRGITYSPDGKTLATAVGSKKGKTIKLWDAGSYKLKEILEGHTDYVKSVVYSPNGKTIATGSKDKTVKLWEAKTGKLKRTLKSPDNFLKVVAYSPNGTTLATGCTGKRVKLWNTRSWESTGTLEGHRAAVRSVAYSPDGKSLATGNSDHTAIIWDMTLLDQGKQPRVSKIFGYPQLFLEGLTIYGVKGLSEDKRRSLVVIGAIDDLNEDEARKQDIRKARQQNNAMHKLFEIKVTESIEKLKIKSVEPFYSIKYWKDLIAKQYIKVLKGTILTLYNTIEEVSTQTLMIENKKIIKKLRSESEKHDAYVRNKEMYNYLQVLGYLLERKLAKAIEALANIQSDEMFGKAIYVIDKYHAKTKKGSLFTNCKVITKGMEWNEAEVEVQENKIIVKKNQRQSKAERFESVGLANFQKDLGNDCWYNAGLQYIFKIPNIIELINKRINEDVEDEFLEGVRMLKDVLEGLKNKIDYGDILTSKNRLRKYLSEKHDLQNNTQHDMTTFLGLILGNWLELTNLSTSVQNYKENEQFIKTIKNQPQAPILAVPIFKKNSIQKNLNYYFSKNPVEDGEKIEDKEGNEVTLKKTKQILNIREAQDAPKFINITLNRFDNQGQKIDRGIRLTEYVRVPFYDKDGKKIEISFKLVGITNHVGNSIAFGHYYSIVKEGKKWIKYNDREVKEIDFRRIKKKEIYSCLYEKEGQIPKVPVSKPIKANTKYHIKSKIEINEYEVIRNNDLQIKEEKRKIVLIGKIKKGKIKEQEKIEIEFLKSQDKKSFYEKLNNLDQESSNLQSKNNVNLETEVNQLKDYINKLKFKRRFLRAEIGKGIDIEKAVEYLEDNLENIKGEVENIKYKLNFDYEEQKDIVIVTVIQKWKTNKWQKNKQEYKYKAIDYDDFETLKLKIKKESKEGIEKCIGIKTKEEQNVKLQENLNLLNHHRKELEKEIKELKKQLGIGINIEKAVEYLEDNLDNRKGEVENIKYKLNFDYEEQKDIVIVTVIRKWKTKKWQRDKKKYKYNIIYYDTIDELKDAIKKKVIYDIQQDLINSQI
ncbi:membrane protein-related [Anaeramoeba flamelloides]|uniref:Membrane protein-related n=1 Tax=Anaeramoeba flamelloides TaxID=1746091 RepID=A0ABQ8ZBK2_9EUKA|nr:membrane protein-related [Anaeramoeba flamelloides]